MLLFIAKKITSEQLKQVAEDLDGYIKIVIDIEREILTAGGKKHVDGEQLLLQKGSKQDNLWGGGLDMETGEIDYNSMINIRPSQKNFSRDIMSEDIRKVFDEIVKKIL